MWAPCHRDAMSLLGVVAMSGTPMGIVLALVVLLIWSAGSSPAPCAAEEIAPETATSTWWVWARATIPTAESLRMIKLSYVALRVDGHMSWHLHR
jgi:hypothetical protein